MKENPYNFDIEVIGAVIIKGDANQDGKINSLDITAVERIIAGLD